MDRNFFEENKLVYLPATLPSAELCINNDEPTAKQPHFWNKETSIWYYPNLLISAYHADKIEDIRKLMGIDKDVKILYDSGGYQMVTLGGNINPKDLIELQLKNSNAGLILDNPPFKIGLGNSQFGESMNEDEISICLNKTKENAKIAMANNIGPNKIRLYGVVQGESWEQINRWYDSMHELEEEYGKFDAWAMSPKPSTIALYGILLLERKIKTPIHFLQATSREAISTTAYIRKLSKNLITIDSSNFSSGTRYGRIINYEHLGIFDIGEGKREKNKKGWFCDCPICRERKIDIENLSTTDLKYINIHNLYQIVKIVKVADWLVDYSEVMFFNWIKKFKSSCTGAIKMLQFYDKYGLERTKLNYSDIFTANDNIVNQKGLFDF